MFNFVFSEKSLELVSSPHFLHDFFKKIYPLLYSIKWQDPIVWLPLHLEILSNVCIVLVCYPGCNIIDLKLNLVFL